MIDSETYFEQVALVQSWKQCWVRMIVWAKKRNKLDVIKEMTRVETEEMKRHE